MTFEFSEEELKIIKHALSNLIEIGITYPQENYLRNIDESMTEKEAYKIFEIENMDYWNHMVFKEKDPLYVLMNKLFPKPI
tara:strand:- start:18 stop:260 length:243 start_codon:yes stop_codon:yes gene_type:complete